MPTVIPVKFAYATRELWFNPAETGAVEGDHVICSTERGTEIGLATSDALEVDVTELNRRTDGAPLKRVLRVATDDDLALAQRLAEKGDAALPTFRRLASEGDLDMKPVGVEYLFGGEKAVCYFAAEERVDFRQLVRDLSRALHERVDMRQIGVREEAALMGGYAHCGQELCCARFGSGFEPVSIRMAKEQDLPLNSNKISGACGRLMCCLRYEFEAYRDFKQRAPKKNAVIQTPLGTAKIIEYDTPKEQICLRLESGKQVRVPLAEMEASPAAHKKSEELGCPCRPDTVRRSTLEKLQSPEIRAALEEVDRKNGTIPQESYEPSDLFVEERGGGRRKRNKGGNRGGAQQRPQRAPEREEQAPRDEEPTRRRRRRKTVEVSAEQDALLPSASSSPENQSAPGEGRRSRRRHHRVEGEVSEQGERVQRQGQGQGQEPQTRGDRERSGRRGDAREQGRGEAQAEGQPRRRRRRPGDKGGQQARGEERGQNRTQGREQHPGNREDRGGSAPRHLRREDGEHAEDRDTEGAAAPRRRRRRHRRGGSEGGDGAAGGPSGE